MVKFTVGQTLKRISHRNQIAIKIKSEQNWAKKQTQAFLKDAYERLILTHGDTLQRQ